MIILNRERLTGTETDEHTVNEKAERREKHAGVCGVDSPPWRNKGVEQLDGS